MDDNLDGLDGLGSLNSLNSLDEEFQTTTLHIPPHIPHIPQLNLEAIPEVDVKSGEWNTLTKDLLVMVMQYLTPDEKFEARMVCKHWYRSYWHGVHVKKYGKVVVQEDIIQDEIYSPGRMCCGGCLLCTSAITGCLACIPALCWCACVSACFGSCGRNMVENPNVTKTHVDSKMVDEKIIDEIVMGE